MPLTHEQRQWAVLGGVFGGGILIAVLIVSLFNGDDSKRAVDVQPKQPSSSTSTTTTTLAPITLPPTTLVTAPPTTGATTPATITPGTTVIVVPPTTKPAPATTTTTDAPTPSSTNKPPSVSAQLDAALEDALLAGEPPDPDAPGRVRTIVRSNVVRVTWALDETLLPEDLPVAAREEATALLRAIQEFPELEDQQILLRATLIDPDTDKPYRVVRLVFERATLDAIDFDTVDPLTIFELADEAVIDPILDLPVEETTTSSSSP